MRKGIIGIYFQGSFDLASRLRMIATLVINDAEQVQAVEMTGLSFQDVPIHLFSFGQLAGPMERHRIAEC